MPEPAGSTVPATPVTSEGISFSVTGARSLFEKTFHVEFDEKSNRPGLEVLELPMPDLPAGLQDAVDAVTFSAPPDFGPTSY